MIKDGKVELKPGDNQAAVLGITSQISPTQMTYGKVAVSRKGRKQGFKDDFIFPSIRKHGDWRLRAGGFGVSPVPGRIQLSQPGCWLHS